MTDIERCHKELAAIEARLRSGDPQVEGLCLALSDWNQELRLLYDCNTILERIETMTITNFKPINKGSLMGAFDLLLDSGFRVTGAMLMETNGSQWISFPGIPYKAQDGNTKYRPILDIPDRPRRDQFNKVVIDALTSEGHLSTSSATEDDEFEKIPY